MGDEDPGHGAGDGCLEILGEAAASAEPGEGALDDPAAGQHLETVGGIGSLDDFDRPPADFGEGGEIAGVAAPWNFSNRFLDDL